MSYEKPELKIIRFDPKDVIVTSKIPVDPTDPTTEYEGDIFD